jgi:hypothetical protein
MVKGEGKGHMLTKTKREEKTGHHGMDGSTSGVEAKGEKPDRGPGSVFLSFSFYKDSDAPQTRLSWAFIGRLVQHMGWYIVRIPWSLILWDSGGISYLSTTGTSFSPLLER